MLVGLVIGIVVGDASDLWRAARQRGARLLCRHHALDPPAGRAGLDLLRLSAAHRALARCHDRRDRRPWHPSRRLCGRDDPGRPHLGPAQPDASGAGARHEPASGDPHHHPAAGADPHAAGARLAVRHRHQGQRHRLGHRRAGALAPDPDRRRQDLPAVRALHGSDDRLFPAVLSGGARLVDRALPPARSISARHDLRLERRLGQPAASSAKAPA